MEQAENNETEVRLEVEGMTCGNCALGITRMLENKGLKQVSANFASGEVCFSYKKEGSIGLDQAIETIELLGYKVKKKI